MPPKKTSQTQSAGKEGRNPWGAVNLLLIDFTEANLRRQMDFARMLLAARDWREMAETQNEFVRDSMRIYAEQAAEIQTLASGVRVA